MDLFLRLLLRVILVPLGYLAAVIAATVVIVVHGWHLSAADFGTQPDMATVGIMMAWQIVMATVLAGTLWPLAIGILISEGLAIRTWIFHAPNGAVSAWVGWRTFWDIPAATVSQTDPLLIAAAGLAAGFAYWAVAGFSAGFWKPVFRQAPASEPAIPQ
jgi:hypothetical protein